MTFQTRDIRSTSQKLIGAACGLSITFASTVCIGIDKHLSRFRDRHVTLLRSSYWGYSSVGRRLVRKKFGRLWTQKVLCGQSGTHLRFQAGVAQALEDLKGPNFRCRYRRRYRRWHAVLGAACRLRIPSPCRAVAAAFLSALSKTRFRKRKRLWPAPRGLLEGARRRNLSANNLAAYERTWRRFLA